MDNYKMRHIKIYEGFIEDFYNNISTEYRYSDNILFTNFMDILRNAVSHREILDNHPCIWKLLAQPLNSIIKDGWIFRKKILSDCREVSNIFFKTNDPYKLIQSYAELSDEEKRYNNLFLCFKTYGVKESFDAIGLRKGGAGTIRYIKDKFGRVEIYSDLIYYMLHESPHDKWKPKWTDIK